MKGARMVFQGSGTGTLLIAAFVFVGSSQPETGLHIGLGLLSIGLALLLNSIFLGQER